jgi:hypothetical protein
MSIVFEQAMDTDVTDWQPPKFETDPSGTKRAGWVQEQIQEGEGYISGMTAYKNLSQNMRIFEGVFRDKTKSKLCTNSLKYNIRKFVETLSDVREIGLFGSDAKQYKPYSEILNKVAKAIYLESQYSRQLRKVLQYASVTGVGYLWPKCKAQEYGFGERRIIFEPMGLMDVLPVQVPASNNVSESYAMTIYEYMPVAEAHGRFPMFQSVLKPIKYLTKPTRFSQKRLDWAETIRYGGETRNWGGLYCEIRYTFIRDMRINTTGQELSMGDADTSWFYKIPFVGQDIFGGIRNGQPYTRKAKLEDCRVYPNLRLMITTPSLDKPMYDGPAFDWHSKMPAVQYTVDDWPWEPGGLSLVDTVGSIEDTKRTHERKMDQVITTRLNPPLGYDRNSTQGPKVENFDIFGENVRAGVDGKPQDTLQSLLPDSVNVTEVNFKFLEYLKGMEEQQLGINDLGNLVNMKLNVGADGMDKMLESIGPIAKGIAATVEASNSEVAYMLKFLIPQWMTTKRIIEYIGPETLKPEIYDYDPDSIIPSHLDDEYVNGAPPFATIDGKALVIPSNYDKIARSREFARNLRLISAPSTQVKVTQLQEQTKYLALFGRGFPISPHTVAKKLGIENFGDIKGDTEFEKWVEWKKTEIVLMAQAKALASELMPQEPGAEVPETGKQHGGGRPPSGQRPPKAVMKDKNTNPRPVVKESR